MVGFDCFCNEMKIRRCRLLWLAGKNNYAQGPGQEYPR